MSKQPNNAAGQVILLHGLLHRGVVMTVFSRRLRRRGFASRIFSYPSRQRSLDQLARSLRAFIDRSEVETAMPLHLVGHSLGGLVILRMLARYARDLPAGRVVLLGSPVTGSQLARQIGDRRLGRVLLGHSHAGLKEGVVAATGRQVGVIAGTSSRGAGRLLARLPEPNDGTVCVAETALAGSQRLLLPVSHFGMLVSPRVARETACFLQQGRFGCEGM